MTGIIKVDTIQNNGGTTGLTIDSSGRVSTPVRPSFLARVSSNQSLSAATRTVVQFGTTDHNVGSHFSTSTYKFTAPVDGIYQFGYHLYIYSTTYSEMFFRIDGTATYRQVGQVIGAARNPNGCHGSIALDLNANQTVDVEAYSEDAATVYSGDRSSIFYGYLVG